MAGRNEPERLPTQEVFVKADELDAGTTILSPGRQLPLSALTPSDGSNIGTTKPRAPPRPSLRRDGSAPPPPPPSQPPPAPPGPPEVTDSLSLPQLRQLVSQFPKSEQRAYAFQYSEIDDYATEIDEWFQYTGPKEDREYLLSSREAFETLWKAFCDSQLEGECSWIEVDDESRLHFMTGVAGQLGNPSIKHRNEALGCIFYVLTGAWTITSGLDTTEMSSSPIGSQHSSNEKPHLVQLLWMHRAADLLLEGHLISPLYAAFLTATKLSSVTAESAGQQLHMSTGMLDDDEQQELSLCLSCFYMMIESARERKGEAPANSIRHALQNLSPSFPVYLTSTISRLRWDESYNIPLIHAIQLLWKLLLLLFGDVQHDLEAVKAVLQPRVVSFSADASHPTLTASPLDYHMFRQEITSKYPAYNPPLPLIPLENEQKTMLPVLSQHTARTDDGQFSASVSGGGNSSSIFHQPVHIATPAPSPPPSPVGPGGKTGKKQNYQTNQNFPFLYPPLDTSSNDLGGKGSTERQDLMVGRDWEGSDVPTSIIEAGELFASRMRMTRGMRQLWKQRDLFMKYDRGWRSNHHNDDEELAKQVAEEKAEELKGLDNPDLRSRMDAVEHFFHYSLADMQSFIIVLMKAMLSNVQDIAVRNGNFADPSQPGLSRTKSNSNVGAGQTLPMPPPPPKPSELNLEDLDNIRSREIGQKAIAGVIFSLLKWLKISHVLKFEYLTQLLLDSNYVQLTLKYFAHQNLEDLVAFRYDRDDLSFFRYCHQNSDHPPLSPTSPEHHSDSGSVDDAIPPPIARHRQPTVLPSETADSHPLEMSPPEMDEQHNISHPAHPTVDELGHPQQPLPLTPLPTFSSRQFQTSIHLLRILQKLTRSKSHRILLLVQFKSSQILRRVLRVPDATLRLYVLKLFKSQVPYCPKKWRQSNMRVITAIYLHCRPELRDEWLAGMHESAGVDGEVEEAVPLEWALRGLCFWWGRRWYGDVMMKKGLTQGKKLLRGRRVGGEGGDGEEGEDVEVGEGDGDLDDDGDDDDGEVLGGQEIEDEERDFFQRELDAMGWGLAGMGLGGAGSGIGDEVAFGEEAPGVGGGAANGAHGGHDGMGGGGGGGGMVWANAANLEQWQSDR